MGQEISCTVRIGGKSVQGKALLETAEILFRGEMRLKIPLSSIKELRAVKGELHVKTPGGVAVFALGDKAEKWCEKILHPKSLVEKLGVKPGDAVSLHGEFDKGFREDLKKHGAKMGTGAGAPWFFLAGNSVGKLAGVKQIAKGLQGAAALWIVYPKGQKSITETDVIGVGRIAGLKDVKVVGFSATRTALKFVIPLEKR